MPADWSLVRKKGEGRKSAISGQEHRLSISISRDLSLNPLLNAANENIREVNSFKSMSATDSLRGVKRTNVKMFVQLK